VKPIYKCIDFTKAECTNIWGVTWQVTWCSFQTKIESVAYSKNYEHAGEFLLELARPVRDIDVQGFIEVSSTWIFDKMTAATD